MMRLTIDRLHVETDPKIDDYIKEKIGKLDHLLNQHARRSAYADVKLKLGPGKGKKQFTCEVIIQLPRETVTTHQTAESLTAAVDLAEGKLRAQLRKYKDKHVWGRRQRIRGIFGQIRRR